MTAPVPTTEPTHIRAGDTASWRLSLHDYPASSGWTLTYTAVKAGAKITFASTADGDDHLIEVAAAATAAYATGDYAWQARATKGALAHTVRSGTWTVLPDFAAAGAAGLDARSHAERTLAALEAWIENRDMAVAEYQVDGHQMRYIPVSELLILRDRYRREVRLATRRPARIYVSH